MAKVSVIINTFNNEQYIENSLKSVLAQTFSDYEIIVVDDGSTDNTKKILKKYDGKIKYLYQDQSGGFLGKARNYAINNSRGEYLAFLDADDMWHPKKLEVQTSYMDLNKEFGLSYTNLYYVNTDNTSKITGKPQFETEETFEGWIFEKLFNFNFIRYSTVMLRRECLNKVGLFDEKILRAADHNLWLRLSTEFKIGKINEVLARYRVHDKQLSLSGPGIFSEELKALKNIAKMFPEHAKRLGSKKYRIFGRIHFELSDYHIKHFQYLRAFKNWFKGNIEELRYNLNNLKEPNSARK